MVRQNFLIYLKEAEFIERSSLSVFEAPGKIFTIHLLGWCETQYLYCTNLCVKWKIPQVHFTLELVYDVLFYAIKRTGTINMI